MAQIKIQLSRVRASSILEVTVAMVLLIGTFSTALLIYLNIVSSQPQLRKFKYEAYITDVIRESVRTRNFIDGQWEAESVTIFKTVESYRDNPRLLLLNVQAKDGLGKIVAESNILIYAPQP